MAETTQRERLVVVTDLDGSLLDEETYAFDAAREALDALRARGIPLILATSKTAAEVTGLAADLGRDLHAIIENGGAILLPSREMALGASREALVKALADIAEETRTPLRGFAQLSVEEIAGLTGLTPEMAARAADRRYDEPFLIGDARASARADAGAGADARADVDADADARAGADAGEDRLPDIAAAARRRGLRVTRGGRFHHLTGQTDKGAALRVLFERLGEPGELRSLVGLGDAANDLSFLQVVDRPIVIPRPGGGPHPDLAAALPHAECAPEPGPRGWNAAVLTVLNGGRLPRIGTPVPDLGAAGRPAPQPD